MDTPARLLEADRCDASALGSCRALVLLEHPETGQCLQFCASHYRRIADAMPDWIVLVDDRPRILGGDWA